MPKSLFVFLVGLTMTPALDPLQAQTNLQADGFIQTGTFLRKFREGDGYTKAELGLSTEKKNDVHARFKLLVTRDSEETVTTMQEAFVERSIGNCRRVQLGLMQQELGNKRHLEHKETAPITDGVQYQRLLDMGYKSDGVSVHSNAHGCEALSGLSLRVDLRSAADLGILVEYPMHLSETLQLVPSLYFATIRINRKRESAGVFSLTLLNSSAESSLEQSLESIVGIDPAQTEFEKTLGDGSEVYFYGLIYDLQTQLWNAETESLTPFIRLEWLKPNRKETELSIRSIAVGSQYVYLGIHGKIGLDWISQNSLETPEKYSSDASGGRLEISYYF